MASEAANILAVRIGAMGDVLHALPAVESLKRSFPNHVVSWLMAPRWFPLLQGNPFVDRLMPFERGSVGELRRTIAAIRGLQNVELAIDFQGLIKSAVAGWLAHPERFIGPDARQAREGLAAWFYTDRVKTTGSHRVEQNLQLAAAAGARSRAGAVTLPQGKREGNLPRGPYVLTTPFAGWKGKEWPLERLDQLGATLEKEGMPLVANVAPSRLPELAPYRHLQPHCSSLDGLIYAVRQASAVIAADSGPLHLAAALGKPGVALFGPTDPIANGPYGGSMRVLRAPGFPTTYKRDGEHHPSMLALQTETVAEALLTSMKAHA